MKKETFTKYLFLCLVVSAVQSVCTEQLYAQQACAIETSTSTYAYTGAPVPISDVSAAPPAVATIAVAGAGPILVDVDVLTNITHTFASDLDFTIMSPAGTIVTLSTDNGAGNDNVFAGTLWNDSANPGGQVPYTANIGLTTDHTYANNVTATPLAPEEPLAAFIGENPNGVWTLTVDDDATTDPGTIVGFSLFFVTTTNLPAGTVLNFVSMDGPIAMPTTAPPNVITSNITVAGSNTFLRNLRLITNLTHINSADLDITVTSPSGTVATLTTDNGGTFDNVFNGTLWDNDANPLGQVPYTNNPGMATDRTYANNVTATPLTPEESFGVFFGENPNGIWTLTISDDANLNGGSFASWSLEVTAIPNQTCDLINCEDLLVDTSPGLCEASVAIPAPEITGLCDGVEIAYSINGGPFEVGTIANLTLEIGVHILVWTSTTVCGTSTCTQIITVEDNEAPVFNCQDIIIDLSPGECDAVVSYNSQATDNCMAVPGIPWQVPPVLLNHEVDMAIVVTGNDLPGGNMFNLTNTSSEIISIQKLEVRFGTSGSIGGEDIPPIAPVSVYATFGNTYVGQQAIPGSWEAIAIEVPVVVGGDNSELSMLPLPGLGILLNPGQTRGIYVFGNTHSLLYNSAAASTAVPFTNGDLSLVSGIATSTLFSGTVFGPPRTPNIVFHYSLGLNATVIQQQGLPSGSVFPVGTTTNCFLATDQAGNTATCCFDVTVNEYSGEVLNALTCNNLVNISVDENCEAILGADVILEGGPYYCYDDYEVFVDQYPGVDVNNESISLTLGLHTVTVSDPLTGNHCWGEVLIEDKLPPSLTCIDVTLPCGVSTEPVFIAPLAGTASAQVSPAIPIGPATGSVTTQFLVINVPDGALVTDVNIYINLNHAASADLDVFLIAPDGTIVELATDVCGTNDNWDVTFDDESVADIPVTCPAIVPTLSGVFRPEGVLGDFDGLSALGIWTLQITDDATPASGGTLNTVVLNVAYFVHLPYAPTFSDNCGDVTLTYEDVELGELCEDLEIQRTWTGTDEAGNTTQCVQTISILPLDTSMFECPPTYLGICGQSYDPSVTGYPTVNGMPISGGACNLFLNYWDKEFDECGNGTKVVRTWTVLDWCTEQTIECEQIIKLLDDVGPFLECPDDQTVGTDPWFCAVDVILHLPDATDACGTPFELTPSVSAGELIYFPSSGLWRVEDLPIGAHTVTWTALDDCGNTSTCEYEITVVDDVPPVPACDEHTILTLTFDNPLDQGLTKLHAITLDDGSYDNCGPVTFLARRMDSCIDFDWIGLPPQYGEYPNNDGGLPESLDQGLTLQEWVPFACCDVGQTRMVELRVTDQYGNFNTCMVEVEVQDKLPPLIVCPPDITVSCDFWFDAHETDGFESTDGLEDVFGQVLDAYVYNESDREWIIIDDPGGDQPQPRHWGLDGWADDNCAVTVTVNTDIDDDCSGDLPGSAPDDAVRLITRTFRAQDGQGNTRTCTQHIWVIDHDRFNITDVLCGLNNSDDVRWPCDLTLTDCPQGALTPENLSDYAPNNRPIVNDDNCSIIGVTYEDQVFYFVDNACYKIIRKWTVIDWCQFAPNEEGGHYGYWTYVQVIKVHDNLGPEFEDCPDGPLTYCVNDPNVALPSNNQVFLGEANPNSSACSVHVWESRTVYETCSDKVIYDVKIYPNNGTEFIQIVEKTTVNVHTGSGTATLTWDTRQNSLPSNHPIRRYGLPYNDRLCSNWPFAGGNKDYHRVLWSVEDGCGNLSTCEYLFRLEDCKQPTPICVGLSSVVMPSTGSVTIWAADFDSGSSVDDCTSHDYLLFSFSGTSYQPSRDFDCDAIAENGSPSFLVEIWVADEGNDLNCSGRTTPLVGVLDTTGIQYNERNKDFCTTFIIIDDNEDVCPGGPGIGGVIETEELDAVALVTVTLRDPANGNVFGTYTTSQSGVYHFVNPLLGGEIKSRRNDDHKNGVSTLDLVKIQKHLLGIQLLDSPYKLIAADANNSQSISALDLVEIRKLVLGTYTEFPKSESWRFVSSAFEFSNPSQPWPFDEIVDVAGLTMGHDFVGVKIGDVNGNVVANATQVQVRNAKGVLEFSTDAEVVVAGQTISVPVSAKNFTQILGYQFTMHTSGLDLTGVEAGALDMTAENIGVHDGAITVSWNKVSPVSSSDVLFTLNFTATESGDLSKMLSISNSTKLTEAEAYNGNEEILDVALRFNSDVLAGKDFALFQNEPNPFDGNTVIGFTLPDAMDATITMYDVTGKVVLAIEGSYAQGYNEVRVNRKDLAASGVMYYRLDANDFTATKKMVVID